MSRSGYIDESDAYWDWIRYRGAVKSALRGKRGQVFLKELRDALDALPQKRLIAHELEADGEVCAIGALGRARGLAMDKMDVDDAEQIATEFGIASAMCREIFWINDEDYLYPDDPEKRFQRVRRWVDEWIAEE